MSTFDAIVICAGQAGLAAGYHLRRAGVRFLILEAGRVGEVWTRRRWNMSSPPLTLAERDALIDFYNARLGAEEPFLFTDPRTEEEVSVRFMESTFKTRKVAPGTHYVELALEETIA